jgi:Tfp pilus assembly protein PilN
VRKARLAVTRTKLSTTVSPDTYEFLQRMVASGQVSTMAEAVDRSIAKIRQLENRRRLALATTQYFEQLEPKAAAEEQALAHDLATAAVGIDFDKEL